MLPNVKSMGSYCPNKPEKMNLYKELFDFLEANNWLSLEDEENAKGVIGSYITVYRPKLHKGQSLPIDSVSSCYSIDEKKPRKNQPILYVGNHGLNEGTYRNYADGVGWVLLPNGGVDCFDEWRPNNC